MHLHSESLYFLRLSLLEHFDWFKTLPIPIVLHSTSWTNSSLTADRFLQLYPRLKILQLLQKLHSVTHLLIVVLTVQIDHLRIAFLHCLRWLYYSTGRFR